MKVQKGWARKVGMWAFGRFLMREYPFVENYFLSQAMEVNKVVDFEAALQAHMKSSFSEFIDKVNATCNYSDDVEETLHKAVRDFKANGSW